MANFRFSKIHQKLKKKCTDPTFGMQVTTILVYNMLQFEGNPMNNVQCFPHKPQGTPK